MAINQDNTGTRLALQCDATPFPISHFFCSTLHRSRFAYQSSLCRKELSSLSPWIPSFHFRKMRHDQFDSNEARCMVTGEQRWDSCPATTQHRNFLRALLRSFWPDGKSIKTPHSRCTLQNASDTCHKRYRTQWGGLQRQLSGLRTTVFFNWFETRQLPRGAWKSWRNETLHSLGSSHRRTVWWGTNRWQGAEGGVGTSAGEEIPDEQCDDENGPFLACLATHKRGGWRCRFCC